MLATPRRWLLALVALAACTPVLAKVTCVENSNGSWTCSGDSEGGYYPPGTVITNIVGTCENCSALSPEDCENIKNNSLSSVSQIRSDVLERSQELQKALSDLESIFYTVDSSVVEVVEPLIGPVLGDLWETESKLWDIDSSVSEIESLMSNIDCSSCTASFDGPPSVVTPTNNPSGGSSSDCPCKEQIQALHNLLKDDFFPRIKKIDTNVSQLTNLIAITREQLRVTKEGFHNVTNLFNRLDDYVLDDFSNKVYQLRVDVNYIASNLASKVSSLFINNNYSNAVFYADNDGYDVVMSELKDKLVDEDNTEGKRFDFGEFGKLPWFTRIEFLLTDIAGYYDKTNSPVSEIEQLKKKVSDFETSSKSDNQSMSNKVESIASDKMSSVNTALSRLWGYFSFFGSGVNSTIAGVEIMGGDLSDYFGEDAQSIHIYAFDNNSQSVAKFDSFLDIVRYCFQALYLAGFSFVLFRLFLFLYSKIGIVINYLLKFYAAIFGSS